MRCEQFERRLHEVLDARINPELDEPLREHAEICPNCRELLGTYDVLLTTVASDWFPAGSRQLAARVIDRWQRSSAHPVELAPLRRHRRTWQVIGGSIVCAAVLLVAISPLLFNGPDGPGGGPAATGRITESKPGSSRRVPALALAGAEITPSRIGAMAHQTGRGLATLVLQFPDYQTTPEQEGAAWLAPVTSSLKPFTPVGEPFNVLLRASSARGQSRSS
jgi:hypothetical protein